MGFHEVMFCRITDIPRVFMENVYRLLHGARCGRGFHTKIIPNVSWFHTDEKGFDWKCKWCWQTGSERFEDA